jgi:predicted dehydrogenase
MIRVGIIGAGEIAQLSHLPMLKNLSDEFEVLAITDASPGVCKLLQKKFHIPKFFFFFEELIADRDINAVFVLTPDPLHCVYVLKSLEAGKHVFVEKPLAMNSGDVRKMMDAEAKHPNQVAMVGYMRRFASSFLRAKKILETDRRPIEYIRFRDIIREGDFYIDQTARVFRAGDMGDLPGGAGEKLAAMKHEQHSAGIGADADEIRRNVYQMLLGLGCHTFSAVRELIGLPKEIKSVLTSHGGTHLVTLLRYDGFIGTYEMINDQSVVQFDAAIEIFQGTRKLLIKYDTPYIRHLPYSLEVIESGAGDSKTTFYGPDYHDAFEAELRHFADCVTKREKPKTSLADSLEDIEFFQKMAKMAEGN